MRAIEGTDPKDLLSQAAEQLIIEQKHAAVTQIKDAIRQVAQLSNDIKTMELALDKKKKELGGANGRLDRFRAGDWSVLTEEAKNEQK